MKFQVGDWVRLRENANGGLTYLLPKDFIGQVTSIGAAIIGDEQYLRFFGQTSGWKAKNFDHYYPTELEKVIYEQNSQG